MKALLNFTLNIRFLRFLLSGGINAIISYTIYLLLLQVLNYQLSYAISYAFGIAIAYLLSKLFIFKVNGGWLSSLLFPLVYLFQYLIGALVLWLVVRKLNVMAEVVPLILIILAVPLTYWLNKLVFIGNSKK